MAASIITPLVMAAGFCLVLLILHKNSALAATWKPAFLLCGVEIALFFFLTVPGRIHTLSLSAGWLLCAGVYALYALVTGRSGLLGRKFAVFGGIFVYLFLPFSLSVLLAFLLRVFF